MADFLIDENLPQRQELWKDDLYIPDSKVWEFAKANNLIIVTRDSDFSNLTESSRTNTGE